MLDKILEFLGSSQGKGAMGLAGLGLKAYGSDQANQLQKDMLAQDAVYKKSLMDIEKQRFDIAKADRARNIGRQEAQEGMFNQWTQGLTFGDPLQQDKEKQPSYTGGLAYA